MGELLRPDIAGDSVRVSPRDGDVPIAAATAPPLWLYLLILVGVPIVFAAMDSQTWSSALSSPMFWLFLLVPLLPLVWWEVAALECRASCERLLLKPPDPLSDPLAELGARCWALANRKRDTASGRRIFDAATWIESTGPTGPRVVLLNCELRAFEVAEDLTEQVDMAAGRKTSRAERKIMWRTLVFSVVLLAAQSPTLLANPSTMGKGLAAFVAVVWFGHAIVALAHLGFRPVTFSAAVAAPGSLEVSRFGRDVVFTRADSVLVLSGTSGSVRASFVRVDRRRFSIYLAGSADEAPHPALVDLLSRWCCRDARPAE